MAYVPFLSGFQIESAAAIDKRLVLTHDQMTNEQFVVGDETTAINFPKVYFCMCPDDGKLYLFNENNTPPDSVTEGAAQGQYGRFKVFEAQITYDTAESITNLNTGLQETETIQTLNADAETEGSVANTATTIAEEIINDATADGGEVTE